MAAKYHPGELCNECFLCGNKYKYYDHYKTFQDEEKQFVAKHLGEHPPDSSCTCKLKQTTLKPPSTIKMSATFLDGRERIITEQ